MNHREIILASSSPRRIEMMKKNNIDPIIIPADIDETLPDNISMELAVMFLALKKGLFVEKKYLAENPAGVGNVIISADTVVYKDGILGKPEDRNDAFSMLSKIKNTSHHVATGVSIIFAGENFKTVLYESTEVFCKDYSDNEINLYLDTDEPYDKAGAYAIQGLFGKHIDHYVGDFDTVVGFPWKAISNQLIQLHVL